MKEKSVFDKIKKQNGERFAQAIRAFDSGIFDVPNLPKIVKYAGRDAEPIMPYLVYLKDIQIEEHGVYQSPIELLKEAGYDAYYADTLEKQNAISYYYAEGEELCTFKDATRFKNYYIINAIKKNVDEIKREKFPCPKREDEYGTSVLSIQILKDGGFISIKNRYNHTVISPDNTFNSNPDNIIPGLAEALKHCFNVDFSAKKVKLPENYACANKQVIKYNYKVRNIYFGENCYVKDDTVHELNKDHELMLDYFILDLKNKTIKNLSTTLDCFGEVLEKEIAGKKLRVITNEVGHKCLLADGVQLLELDKGKIINVNLPTTKEIGENFLYYNKDLASFNASQLEKIGDYFLYWDSSLCSLNAPQLKEVGMFFLMNNNLRFFNAPLLPEDKKKRIYKNNPKLSRLSAGKPGKSQETPPFNTARMKMQLTQARDRAKAGHFKSSALPKFNLLGALYASTSSHFELFALPKIAIRGAILSSTKKKAEKPKKITRWTVSRSRQTNTRSRVG